MRQKIRRQTSILLLALGTSIALAGCSPITTKHGHQFQESDLQQIQPGMTADAVRLALGTPATTSTVVGGNSYYYISSTETQTAFFKPTEVDRKVLAIYFNPTGTVVGGNSYYYISSTETQAAFFKPTEVDRKVLAIYFNPTGTVDRVAHYGMKDGKIFDYVKRQTPSHVKDQTLLQQIFRGVGQKQSLFD